MQAPLSRVCAMRTGSVEHLLRHQGIGAVVSSRCLCDTDRDLFAVGTDRNSGERFCVRRIFLDRRREASLEMLALDTSRLALANFDDWVRANAALIEARSSDVRD